MPLKISDEDITSAEKILLKEGGVFDDERRTFIKHMETVDLQAVPGSGKTTALLAKLLAIEKQLPLKDESGILVISHTNAAIDQIKRKIGIHCPKLFAYPNYVGTIQSFVDQFLAIPFGHSVLNKRIERIDTELYQELLWRRYQSICWSDDFSKPGAIFYGRHISKCLKEAKGDKAKAGAAVDLKTERDVKGMFLDFKSGEIKTGDGSGTTLIKDPENKRYQGLRSIIEGVISKQVISYRYAYAMADAFVDRAPVVKRLLRKRFQYVFVDEMQDMESHQSDLLDSLFHCEEVVFQRIGDKNQAIFSEQNAVEGVWQDRDSRLPLNGSHRLSPHVAEVVNNFAVDTTFRIEGRGKSTIAPCMIVFSPDCADKVLTKFAELVDQKVGKKAIAASNHPIKLIGWRKEADDPNKLGIKSFYADFDTKHTVSKATHAFLRDYLTDSNPASAEDLLRAISKNILEGLIAVLRSEEIVQDDGKYYSPRALLKHLRGVHREFYEKFKLKLYEWSKGVHTGRIEESLNDIRDFAPLLLEVFGKKMSKSSGFINGEVVREAEGAGGNQGPTPTNVFRCPNTGLEVEIGTVHSAKGETHLATLYVETFFEKKHESERLSCCFCGETKALSGDFDRKSARIAYVAMSRPTHLLCFAILDERYKCMKDKVKGWEIVDLRGSV